MTFPERPLDERYRIEVLADSDLTEDDILRLWAREGAVAADVAEQRVREVLLVARVEATGELIGVSSVYLHPSPRLGMHFWHERVYVAEQHRLGHAGFQLTVRSYTELERRFLEGLDRRGSGAIVVLQDPFLKQTFTRGHETWDALFLGENERGDHVRVRYFPGAVVPPPPRLPTVSASP